MLVFHISDGVLSLPIAVAAAALSIGIIAYAAKDLKSEEIPKISLLTGAFFVASTINLPIGPSSVHLLLIGLMGILLARRAPLAILIGLVMQASLFQHGGIIAIGVNFVILSIPAILVGILYQRLTGIQIFWRSTILGGIAIIVTISLLIIALLFSDDMYRHGTFSVINTLAVSHIPLIFIEGFMTGFIVRFVQRVRPQLITSA